jgi:hypothetical protein
VLSGNLALLAPAWLVVSVTSCALPGSRARPAALGVLGDVVAMAGLAALAVDARVAALPYAGGPPVPWWAAALVAVGVAVRALVPGGPGVPVVVACAIAARMTGAVAPGDLGWLVVAAPASLLAALAALPAGAVALLGVATWGIDHPMAPGAGATLLTGAALAAAVAALATPGAVEWVRVRAGAVSVRWPRLPFPATAALAAGAAGAAGAVLLLRVPVSTDASALVVATAALAVPALLAAVLRSFPGAATALPGAAGGDVRPRAGAAAVAALVGLVFVAPGVWVDALGLDSGPFGGGEAVAGVLRAGRSGLLAGIGLGLAVLAALAGGQRLRTRRGSR